MYATTRHLFELMLVDISPAEGKEMGLSENDMRKRLAAYQNKKFKLKNPNYFVSRTRLSIRNIPIKVTEKELSQLVTDKLGKISLWRVWLKRDSERKTESGQPRSFGFGFLDFREHDDAMTTLEYLNNNPDIFGEEKRPIVEFSIENAQAVAKLEYVFHFFRRNTSEVINKRHK
ncbi:Nucleotide-binding, alpha-beta plait [Pelomyxa schiedti]|nr:Nucleotide-binding, alpha-beta plait [Pelomyxa schiedti]